MSSYECYYCCEEKDGNYIEVKTHTDTIEVCEDCLEDVFGGDIVSCYVCNEYVAESDSVYSESDDAYYCFDCKYVLQACDFCDNLFDTNRHRDYKKMNDKGQTFNICFECMDERILVCENCGEEKIDNDVFCKTNPVCFSCIEKDIYLSVLSCNEIIENEYKDETCVLRILNPLSFEDEGSYKDALNIIYNYIHTFYAKEHLYFESGFFLNTYSNSLNHYRKSVLLDDCLKKIKGLKLSYNHQENLKILVNEKYIAQNKNDFVVIVGSLLFFIETNWDKIIQLFQPLNQDIRYYSDKSEISFQNAIDLVARLKPTKVEGYVSIDDKIMPKNIYISKNLYISDESFVGFNLFSPTLNKNVIIVYLEFVDSIINFCLNLKQTNDLNESRLNWMNYLFSLDDKDYSYLKKYLKYVFLKKD